MDEPAFTATVAVGDLTPSQRNHLETRLYAEGIEATFAGDRLRVDQAWEQRVERLVDEARAEPPGLAASPPGGAPTPPGTGPGSLAPALPGGYPPGAYGGGPYGGGGPYDGGGPYRGGGDGGGGYGYAPAQVANSNATLSIIFAVLAVALCGLCAIPAIIYGRTAQAEIRASGGMQSGEGLAKAAVIIGWIYLGIMGLAVVGFAAAMLMAALVAPATH